MKHDESTKTVAEGCFPIDEIPDDGEYTWIDAKMLMPSTSIMTAEQLGNRTYPMVEWIILDVMPKGATLFVGDPKVGKTRLISNLAISIARGEKALGKLECKKRGVLCLFLEDSPRRVQERFRELIPDSEPWPDNLYIVTDWPTGEDGLRKLDETFNKHPDIEVVFVDVLERIRAPFFKGSVYQYDYKTIAALKKIADEHDAAIVIVHHTGKDENRKTFQKPSGSQGLMGAADTGMVLEKRDHKDEEAILSIIGREVEPQDLSLEYDPDTGRWTLLGDAAFYVISDERKQIFDYVAQNPDATPKQTSNATGKNYNTTKNLMRAMRFDGILRSNGKGGYRVAEGNEPRY